MAVLVNAQHELGSCLRRRSQLQCLSFWQAVDVVALVLVLWLLHPGMQNSVYVSNSSKG